MQLILIYCWRRFLPWFAIGIAASVFMFLTTQLVRVAPVLLSAGASAGDTAAALGLLLIPVVTWALTPAFIIAIFAVAAEMRFRGELIALDACGIGHRPLVWGHCVLMAIVAIASAWLWLSFGPRSQSQLRILATELAATAIFETLQPGQFSSPIDGIAFYADHKNARGFRGVFIDDTRPASHRIQIAAEHGRVSLDPSNQALTIRLNDGTAFIQPATTPSTDVAVTFQSLEVHSSLARTVHQRLGFLPSVMAIPTRGLVQSQSAPNSPELEFELYRRVFGPIGFVVLALMAIQLAFKGTWRSRTASIAVAIGGFGLFHLLGRLAESSMRQHQISPFIAAAAPSLMVAGVLILSTIYQFALLVALLGPLRLSKIYNYSKKTEL